MSSNKFHPDNLIHHSMAELQIMKAQLSWDVAQIEGDLLEHTKDEEWRTKAKSAVHWKRRDLGAVNNTIAAKNSMARAMWGDDDVGSSVMVTLSLLLQTWDRANAVVECEDDDLLDDLIDRLADSVEKARDVRFACPLD